MPRLRLPLFLTRLSIFYFLLPWQISRFTSEGFTGRISETYYHGLIPDSAGTIIGVFWLLLLAAFVTGFAKRISYGLVFALHAIAILVALPSYIFGSGSYNQLFLAAIPAAMAMLLLYLLRDEDTLLAIGK